MSETPLDVERLETSLMPVEQLLMLIARCLVPMAFAVSPDGGLRQAELEAIAREYAKEPQP